MQSDGFFGFYRGLGISLAASGPGVALYITSYEQTKKLFLSDPQQQVHKKSKLSSAAEHLICGLAAESVSCVVWVPMDVVKERLQSQHSGVAGRYRSSWHGIATLYRLEGVAGMYKGYFSTLGSFGPFSAIYFAAFEETQLLLRDRVGLAERLGSGSGGGGVEKALAAALANIFACVVTNPLEVSKTRYQVQRAVLEVVEEQQLHNNNQHGAESKPTPKKVVVGPSKQFKVSSTSMLDALKWSAKNEGLLALWSRGLVARILFQTPCTAVTFGLYEAFKKNLCAEKQK